MPYDQVEGPGLALARAYAEDVVAPVMAAECPGLSYAAARVGAGSEVLGLDDVMSQDHDWGLRLQLFVSDGDVPVVRDALDRHLPDSYRGHPVRFARSGEHEARLGVEVTAVARFAHDRLGFDPRSGVTVGQWLSVSGQAALEVVAGEVFVDPVGELTRLRGAVTWYPDDLWRYVVACDWQRLDQELPLMARAGDRGDEVGSWILAARLADVAVHLAFMLARAWPPYPKWRGTVLGGLAIGPVIAGDLRTAVTADPWPDRSDALGRALEHLAAYQSGVGLPTVRPAVVGFWDRPYLHIEPTMVMTLLDPVAEPDVRALPRGLGSIDQRTDNVDLLMSPARRLAAILGLPGA